MIGRGPVEPTPAVLLRSVAYGESDRVVTLLTEAHGKVSAMARGARRSQRRFAGALEPFARIEVELVPGAGALARLDAARLVRGFPGLLGSLAGMEAAGAALERVRTLAPEHAPLPGALDAIERLFARLDAAAASPPPELGTSFALRLLALVGWPPRLDACGRCGRAAETRAAFFDPQVGALVCRACGGGPVLLGAATRIRMLGALGDRWDDLALGWSARERAEAAGALAAFFARHVGGAEGGPGV